MLSKSNSSGKARKRDAEMTKASILEAAEALFSEFGYKRTSIRDISKKCGASAPLIMFHFKDKRSVYKAVKANIITRFNAYFQPSDEPVDCIIESLAKSMFDFYKENPKLVRMIKWGRLEDDDESWEGEERLHEYYMNQLKLAQKNGRIRSDIEPFYILVTLNGAFQLWSEYRESFALAMGKEKATASTDDEYLEQVIEQFKRGLAPA